MSVTDNYLKTILGASGNGTDGLSQGALGPLIRRVLQPSGLDDDQLRNLALLQGFSKMTELASKPGATAVGAGFGGLSEGAKQYIAGQRQQRADDLQRLSTGLTLASTLRKIDEPKDSKEYEAQEPITIDGVTYNKGDNLFLTKSRFNKLIPSDKAKLTTSLTKVSDKVDFLEDAFGEKIYASGPNKLKPVFSPDGKVIDYSGTADTVATTSNVDDDTTVKRLTKIQKDDLIKAKKAYVGSAPVKRFRDLQANFKTVLSSYDKAYTLDEPKVADLAMIFAFMKMLDPRSVVREGEQQQAKSTSSYFNYLANMYNSLLGTGSLTDTQRKSFRDGAYGYFQEQLGILADFNKQEKDFAGALNIPFELYQIDPEKEKFDITGYNVKIPKLNYEKFITREEGEPPVLKENIPSSIKKEIDDFLKTKKPSDLLFISKAKNVKINPLLMQRILIRSQQLKNR